MRSVPCLHRYDYQQSEEMSVSTCIGRRARDETDYEREVEPERPIFEHVLRKKHCVEVILKEIVEQS
jgi:hypothetical protein